jgi:DNA mismatch repair protein MLH1
LFYNVPARRKAFKNPSDEYSRIFDMVMRYALHNSGVSFNLKKHGDTKSDVHTTASTTLKVFRDQTIETFAGHPN